MKLQSHKKYFISKLCSNNLSALYSNGAIDNSRYFHHMNVESVIIAQPKAWL